MAGFQIRTSENLVVRFWYFPDKAPLTCKGFNAILPFERILFHARVSGLEIWTEDGPKLDLPQENASIFAEKGEIVLGPLMPERNKIKGCLGIFYGEGRLLDCGNIFGKVHEEDLEALQYLGDTIWRKGGSLVKFELFQPK